MDRRMDQRMDQRTDQWTKLWGEWTVGPLPSFFISVNTVVVSMASSSSRLEMYPSPLVSNDVKISFSFFATSFLPGPSIHTRTITRLKSSVLSSTTNEKHAFPSVNP